MLVRNSFWHILFFLLLMCRRSILFGCPWVCACFTFLSISTCINTLPPRIWGANKANKKKKTTWNKITFQTSVELLMIDLCWAVIFNLSVNRVRRMFSAGIAYERSQTVIQTSRVDICCFSCYCWNSYRKKERPNWTEEAVTVRTD